MAKQDPRATERRKPKVAKAPPKKTPKVDPVDNPTADPRYQKLVKEEGQAKGSADYAHQFVDPKTLSAKGWSGMGSADQIKAGIASEKARGGLFPTALGDIGSFIMSGGGLAGGQGGLGQALFGGGSDPAGGGKGGKGKGKGGPTAAESAAQKAGNAEASAATGLMDSLVNQYQQAMNVVNPYINGSAGAQAVNTATSGTTFPTGPAPANEEGGLGMIQGDAQKVAQANQAGASGVASALHGVGAADALSLQMSPYMGILNALGSEAQYKTMYGTPPFNIKNTPEWVQQAYASIGTNAAPGLGVPGAPGTPTPVSGGSPVTAATSPSTSSSGSPAGSGI